MTKSVWIRLAALASLWGSEFLFIKIALRGFNSVELTAMRLALASVLLFVITKIKGENFPKDAILVIHCAILGLFAAVVPYFLMAWAETRVSSALTGILVGAGPLLTAILAAVVVPSEKLSPLRFVGLSIGLAGVVFVIDPFHSFVNGDLLGCLAALGVALGFAVGYVYNVRFLTSHEASGPMIMSIQSAFGAIYATAWLVMSGEFHYTANGGSFASIVILGLFNTGFAAIVFFSLLRDAGAVTTSMVEYLMVIVAVLLGLIFLNENISLISALGVLLVIGGVAITERKPKISTISQKHSSLTR